MKKILKMKRALVTGGNRGIGRAIALSLAKNGAAVCITGRNKKTLTSCLKELKRYNKDCMALPCDVRIEKEQKKVFGRIMDKYKKLDICIPNAGEATLASATQTSLEQWNHDIGINLTGVFITAKEAMKIMMKQKSGNIIGIVSKSGKGAAYLRAAYGASKWGALGFLKSLAIEGRNNNVKVSAICPGCVATDFQKGNPSGMEWMMSADAVAQAVQYILSLEDKAYVDELVLSTWERPADKRG
ncbi:MAG: SDR family oxidoreductase [Candidatus Omnitrophota bacterium]|nr:SDR family oxidoreductase [Candidatus Omnitrophota bacterium]MBU2528243.1 SDR family oxidoreductase [bacterium]MBU3929621.1 SDR family oxidoreductase [bacterium]MBU4122198.1 SDR family oxidoreductase [bacterium]